ncbi:MAG: type II secretion system protein [Lachnospira sp.]
MMHHNHKKLKFNNKGFSLVELLVVIAIMAIVIGGVVIGVSVIVKGNVKKAGNNLYSELTNLRTQTLSINADWKLSLEKDGSKLSAVTYKSGKQHDKKDICTGYSVMFYDYETAGSTPTEYNLYDNTATFTYSRTNGRFQSIEVGENSIDVNKNLKGVIVLTKGSKSYTLTLWYNTGRITIDN